MFVFFLSRLLALFTSSNEFNIKSCTSKNEIQRLIIDSVSIQPYPLKQNSLTHVTIQANMTETIKKGSVILIVIYENFQLIKKEYDICETLKKYRTQYNLPQCPLSSGKKTYNQYFKVSLLVPSGLYRIHAEAFDEKGQMIFCYIAAFQIIK